MSYAKLGKTSDDASGWILLAAVTALARANYHPWLTRGGFSRKDALCVGSMMNTRGLMELVVIHVGYELGIIPQSVFSMLVLMAVVTTMMTTPLLLWFRKNTELEPYLESWLRSK